MKFFRKNQLQIQKEESKTTIRWWRLNAFDLMLVVLLPIQSIWGIASACGSEEIWGMRVLSMSIPATVIFWSLVFLIFMHLFFNRIVCLEVSREEIYYFSGRFPRRSRRFAMHGVSNVEMKEKAENFAESSVGEDLTSYHLYINSTSGRRIRIKDLSKKDIEIVRDIIRSYRSIEVN